MSQALPHSLEGSQVCCHQPPVPQATLPHPRHPITTRPAPTPRQVHRAWLKDGTPVAVKVQYPGLAGAVLADCASMKALARAGAALFPEVNLVWLFEELQRWGCPFCVVHQIN